MSQDGGTTPVAGQVEPDEECVVSGPRAPATCEALTIRAAVTALTADPDWRKKVIVGVFVNLIPYVGMFWFLGYALTYLRQAAWEPSSGLPQWQPAAARLKTGFFALVVGMVYSLPLSLLFGMAMFLSIMGLTADTLAGGPTWETAIPAVLIFVVFVLASVAYGIVLFPVYAHIALYDSIQAGFDIKDIYSRARNHADVFWPTWRRSLALALLSVAFSLVGVLGIIALIVGGTFLVLPDELRELAFLLVLPAEVVALVVISFVTLPVALVTYRLWAAYAQAAYLQTPPPDGTGAGTG